MNVLFSWYDFLMKDWFIKIIREYLEEVKINKTVWHFHRNNLKEAKDIVWTNESRCANLDYELFYRQYEKIFYIIRNPIDAMLNYFIRIHKKGEDDFEFFQSFIKRHLIGYITHFKCHRKITNDILIYEKIRDDFNYFLNIIKYLNENINENILYDIYCKYKPNVLNRSKLKEEDVKLIKKIWEENDLEWYWK